MELKFFWKLLRSTPKECWRERSDPRSTLKLDFNKKLIDNLERILFDHPEIHLIEFWIEDLQFQILSDW